MHHMHHASGTKMKVMKHTRMTKAAICLRKAETKSCLVGHNNHKTIQKNPNVEKHYRTT